MAFNRSAQQTKTSTITISSIVGSAAFQAGVKDFQAGRAEFDKYVSKSAWRYERGRLFAALCAAERRPVPPSRSGRAVSRVAIDALYSAFRSGAVR